MNLNLTRREMLGATAVALGAVGLGVSPARSAPTTAAPSSVPGLADNHKPMRPGQPGRDYHPVITPNNQSLPFDVRGGVKIFHLTVSEIQHEFCPGLTATTWGYNGHTHGPTIEAVEGDRVRFYVTNKLPAPTTIHWHGIILPNGMDGVSGLTQLAIMPGQTFKYEFTLVQHGTYMYHSHHDTMTQEGMGLTGLFIIHPRDADAAGVPQVDKDFALLLHEWRVDVGSSRPNPNEMTDFNIFTMNAKAFPGTDPLLVKRNDKVRIRLGNLSAMDHHPIHLHGYQFPVVEIDGARVPKSAQRDHVTVLVPVGGTRAFELTADKPGDWFMHCHMTHHIMNQMGDNFPNMIGVDAKKLDRATRDVLPQYMTMGTRGMGEMGQMHMAVPDNSVPMKSQKGPFDQMTFGGMATILKVHDDLSQGPGGWYRHPEGEVVGPATDDDLQRDGIMV